MSTVAEPENTAPETDVPVEDAPVEQPQEQSTEAAPEQPVAETQGAAETETAEAAEPPGFVDQLGNYGFGDVTDEAEGQARLLEAYGQQQEHFEELQRQLGNLVPVVETYEGLVQSPQWAQYQQWLQEQQQYEQQQQVEEQYDWWSPPDLNLNALQPYVVEGEDGSRSLAPHTPPELRQAYHDRVAYEQEWQNQLLTDPQAAVERLWSGAIENRVNQLVEQRFQGAQQQHQEQQTLSSAQQLIDENRSWMYQRDPVNPQADAIDPRTGQARLTPAGEIVNQKVAEAANMGINNLRDRWQYAINMTYADVLRHQGAVQQVGQTAAQTAAQTNQQLRDQHVLAGNNMAEHIPPAGGSVTGPDGAAQNRHVSPGRQLLDAMVAEGHPTDVKSLFPY